MLRYVFLAVAPLFAAAGCSSEGTVKGKVTYQGRPLTGGTVLFTSATGSSSSSIGEDGSYTISGIKKGEVRIAVDTKSARGNASMDTRAKKEMGKAMKNLPPEAVEHMAKLMPNQGKKAEAIPDKYASPETSELTYTVKGGSQEYNIELK